MKGTSLVIDAIQTKGFHISLHDVDGHLATSFNCFLTRYGPKFTVSTFQILWVAVSNLMIETGFHQLDLKLEGAALPVCGRFDLQQNLLFVAFHPFPPTS